jgi:hypothetical protein
MTDDDRTPEYIQMIEDLGKHATDRASQVVLDFADLTEDKADAVVIFSMVASAMCATAVGNVFVNFNPKDERLNTLDTVLDSYIQKIRSQARRLLLNDPRVTEALKRWQEYNAKKAQG